MAKKRRVKPNANRDSRSKTPADSAGTPSGKPAGATHTKDAAGTITLANICLAILAGALIYVSYFPSDSVAVESGDALWFGVIAILVGTIAISDSIWNRTSLPANLDVPDDKRRHDERRQKFGIALDCLACGLPIWIMLAAFFTSASGNLRLATNEAWLWVSGAAVFMASRRIFVNLAARRTIVLLIALCAIALAVHGLHQEWISLPQLRAQYESDPDAALAQIGIFAPPGSSARMVFANRLYDGGATGTFALANSLAGVLLVGCLIAIAALRFQWRQMQRHEKATWIVALLICAVCLSYARSRSATAATILGAVAILLAPYLLGRGDSDQTNLKSRMRKIMVVAAACLGAMLAATTMIAAFGKSEWFEQAVPSLAFRFQYWRSTWQLALDHPLFGCGPGNFKAIYLQYREISANEQIADPHNFLFETLASGGFIALAGLVALLAVGAWVGYQNWFADASAVAKQTQTASDQNPSDQNSSNQGNAIVSKWSWLGAGVALFLIWLLGFVSGQFPDFQAQAIAVPMTLGFSLLLWPAASRLSSNSIDLISAVCVGALLVHLLVAGGWTVPGVAMLIWLLAGALTRLAEHSEIETLEHPKNETKANTKQTFAPLAISIATGALLLLCLNVFSLKPVQRAAREMGNYQAMQQPGQRTDLRSLQASLQRVIEADPWSPEGHLSQADLIHWQIVTSESPQNSTATKQWETSLDQAMRLAGQSPSLNQAAAQQILHVYQRWGNRSDLNRAQELLDIAAKWSPADHWITAQLAAIAETKGESVRARKLAKEAKLMAQLGNNIVRSLDLQMIYAAEVVGTAAIERPKIVPASKALANQLDNLPVLDQN